MSGSFKYADFIIVPLLIDGFKSSTCGEKSVFVRFENRLLRQLFTRLRVILVYGDR